MGNWIDGSGNWTSSRSSTTGRNIGGGTPFSRFWSGVVGLRGGFSSCVLGGLGVTLGLAAAAAGGGHGGGDSSLCRDVWEWTL